MPHLLEEEHFLQYLPSLVVVLHQRLVHHFYGHLLPSQLVHSQGHLSKGALSDEFREFVVIQGSHRNLPTLLDRELDIFYQLLSLFNHFIIKDRLWLLLLSVLDLEEHIFHGTRLDQVGGSSSVGEPPHIILDDRDILISVSLLTITLQTVHPIRI